MPQKIDECELPPFVERVDNKLKVRTEDWSGKHEAIISKEDIYDYIYRYRGDITTTYRCLGLPPDNMICGDWRQMDTLVSILKDVFDCIEMYEKKTYKTV